MNTRILVINPNSNQAVTDGISAAVAGFRIGGAMIDCETLEDGPFGIESQHDVEAVALPLRARMMQRTGYDAYVIACYSDPGLHVCREAMEVPVFGIQECAIATALTRGDRFGVIAIAQASIRRHLRAIRVMGVEGRLAAERALNMSVAETEAGAGTFSRLEAVGGELRDLDGADVVILGCAGMAKHRARLEHSLGVPIIDPCQAAVGMALTSGLCGNT
jgi:Asp/Glu/hydantoin racemase